MRYGKIVATGLCVVFLAAAAQAGVVLLDTWQVNRDNFNDTWDNDNHGGDSNNRAAKRKQETTWYGDWSAPDLTDLKTQITALQGGGGIYGTDYWVEFSVSTCASWAIHGGAAFTPRVSAFMSNEDWLEDEATDNVARSGVSWLRHTDSAAVEFWGLIDIDNVAEVVGNWDNPTTGPSDIKWNTAALDEALVTALTDDATCRGLRMWDENTDPMWNDQTYAREQWSGTRTGPARGRLQLFFKEPVPPIPEPAGLSLMGLALLALRRRRS